MTLESRVREMLARGELDLPFPGRGETALRHRRLAEFGRMDLGVARLAEAHTDAVAILAEAGREPRSGLYGVWAAETSGCPLTFDGIKLAGTKMFCTGADFLDRALVTVDGTLLDVNLRASPDTIRVDSSAWKTCAFAETRTATVIFSGTPAGKEDVIGEPNWYLDRVGFWHGACGPAACWAGGAKGLVDYALRQFQGDCHTMAHLGAMDAGIWGLCAYLEFAGNEIDSKPRDKPSAHLRALRLRHLVDQACADVLTRFGRAYGPRALAFDDDVSRRYQELELYIRQCHAERDLEFLGKLLPTPA